MPNNVQPTAIDHLSSEERLIVSEKRLRLLADNTKDVVWTMSPQGEITYVSQAIEKLRGVTPEEAMRQTLAETLTPGSQAESIGYFQRLLTAVAAKTELPTYRGDMEYYRKDGSTFWTEVFAFPLTNAHGELVEVLGVTRDISERQQHEESLMRAREVAEQANAAKSRFVAHVSHEIRTPMTSMLSWIQLALNQAENDLQQDTLIKAQGAGQILLGIINDLLDLTRMEHGSFHLSFKSLNIADIVAQIQEFIAPSIRQKGLVCTATIDPQVPSALIGDPLRLTQALLNLANNAVKFTDQGSIHIDVSCESREGDTMTLRFTVKDTGIGIDPKWRDKLFHDLVQVPEAQVNQRSGTGLGLAICKRLAFLMNGSVGFDSTIGSGSEFWFTARLHVNQSEVEKPTRKKSNFGRQDLAGKRILLVDDDISVRQATARLLEWVGIDVDQAENGTLALDRLKSEKYDLVFIDLSMPVMGGEECTRLIRQHLRLLELPIIGFTAAGFTEDRMRCIAAGMNDYLTKPFEFDVMIDMISKYLPAGEAITKT